jgi:CRP-like cAMP-binding protein
MGVPNPPTGQEGRSGAVRPVEVAKAGVKTCDKQEGRRSAPETLIVGLRASGGLAPREEDALRKLPMRVETIATREDVVAEGGRPDACCLIVQGFFSGHKKVGGGHRQITSFHLPGDIPDLHAMLLDRVDFSVSALTPSSVAFIAHRALRDAMVEAPTLCEKFWRHSLTAAVIGRVWLSSVGRHTAYQRMAHLFCELFTRMRMLGLGESDGFLLPMTQVDLADALGLSTVHVNRTLQQLRRDGVIKSRGRHIAFTNLDRLRDAADFDADYLNSSLAHAALETPSSRID